MARRVGELARWTARRPHHVSAAALAAGPGAGSRVLARARRGLSWPAEGAPGTELRVRGPLSAPVRRPGQRLDWPAYLRRRGIGAELELDALSGTGRRRGGLAGAVDRARTAGESALDSGMS